MTFHSHSKRSRVLGPVLLAVSVACCLAGCASRPSQTIAVAAQLVPNPAGDATDGSGKNAASPDMVVMSTITVRDSNDAVIATPRVCSELNQRAAVSMQSHGAGIHVELIARQEGEHVVVDAVLKDADGASISSSKAVAAR